MKYFFLVSFLILSISNSFSQVNTEDQTDARDTHRNELSINAFNLVAFGIIDLTYERVINENSTWALEGFFHPEKNDANYNDAFYKKLSLTGKYKYFFSSNFARGFYIHSFGMISGGEYDRDIYSDNSGYTIETNDYTDFALGFGVGGKFLSQAGVMADISGGLGRNLFNENSPKVIGQFMINLGYRF